MSETISYTLGDDTFDAVIEYPAGDAPAPAVLVCHAWGGRDDFAEGKAKKLAELGYVGAAIDIYGVGKRGTDNESCNALMSPLMQNPEALKARLKAAFDAVQGLDRVDSERMGSIGFCFGGLCTILMARMGLPLRGVVSFHALLKLVEKLESKPQARILLQHGLNDPMAPPEEIGVFAEEMKRVGADWTLHAYPGVLHAFTVPSANDPDFGTVYDAHADAQSWREMKSFLEETLQA